jgi:UDP-galactopyranose mutase
VDDFYDQSQGVLPYRSIKFDFRLAQPRGVHSVINWCDTRPCTRTTDYACFYDKPATTTVLGDEYPQDYCPWEGLMPSYPMRGFPEADAIMARYDALSPGPNTLLCGRLGAYRYMNMDQVISDTMFKLESKLGGSVY